MQESRRNRNISVQNGDAEATPCRGTRRLDIEEDVALVDVNNAATASVLSPNIWIKKPSMMSKSPYPMKEDEGGCEKGENVQPLMMEKTVADQGEEEPRTGRRRRRRRSSYGGFMHLEQWMAEEEEDVGEAGDTPGSSGRQAPSLAPESGVVYGEESNGREGDLDVGGDIEKEFEENERAEQDLKEISDIEAEIAKMKELAKVLESMLTNKTMQMEELQSQNTSIKRMLNALSVHRNDFDMEGLSPQEQQKKMIEIGERLIESMRGSQQDGGLQQEQKARALNTRDLDRMTGKMESSLDEKDVHGQEKTPVLANKSVSHGVVTDPSAHPIESQIAAAALIAARQEPARALVSLLEKALEARERKNREGFGG